MEHEALIWSKDKKSGRDFLVEKQISQKEIEEWVIEKYTEEHSPLNENREYWAEIDKTNY
jgi:hypothetical protein